MKRILVLLAIMPMLVFTSCSKEEDKSPYTDEQQNALNTFTGQFKCEFEGKRWETIKWKENFSTPRDYTMNLGYDETTTRSVHGIFESYYWDNIESIYQYAYSISIDGRYITLYSLNSSNEIYKTSKDRITIVSNDEFKIYSSLGDDKYNPFANIYFREPK